MRTLTFASPLRTVVCNVNIITGWWEGLGSQQTSHLTTTVKMGQDTSKMSHLRKCIKNNDRELSAVKVEGVQVSDKTIRKLSEALRRNR